ncbi:MAG: 4Fe-4S dicluster domain-containing protein [Desulfovibrio sp.]|nr:4Fe-4S dicluster domain-containing protein [Desulfovibrio sp.]
MSYLVTVDAEKCTGCGECVDICPAEVYELEGGKSVPAKADDCLGCQTCVDTCESKAINVDDA